MIRILETKYNMELTSREAWELYREIGRLPCGFDAPRLLEIYQLLQEKLEPPEESAKCVTNDSREAKTR